MVLLMTAIEVYGKYYAIRERPPLVSTVEASETDADGSSSSPDKVLEPSPSLSQVK
jgi:hypothetical protein